MLWLVISLLILATLAILLIPFFRGIAKQAPRRIDFDIVVYRSQLAEIEQEIERGLLTPEQADAARAEVHRRMLAAEDAELKNPVPAQHLESGRSRLAVVVAIAVLVPLGAGAVYGALGSPQLPGKPYAWRQTHDPDFVAASTAEKLAQTLQTNPSAAGYKRLSAMYFEARQFDQAAAAYHRAIDLGARDAETWSGFGESVVMANGGAVIPDALMAFTKAMDIDPHNPRSRFYVGLAEAQIGKFKEAVGVWRDLAKDSPPDAPWLSILREQIAAAGKQGGFDPASVAPKGPDLKQMNVALAAMTNMHAQETSGPATPQGPTGAPNDIRAMVARFAEKMEKNPADVGGWQKLAHSYVVLGDSDKALKAIDRAVALKPADVGVLLSLAEVQKAAAGPQGKVPEDFDATMRKVLGLDPNNTQALYYVGIAELEAGHADRARALWRKALKTAAADDPLASEIQGRLSALGH